MVPSPLPSIPRMKPDSRWEFVVQESRVVTESSNPNIFSSQVALSPGPEVLSNGGRSRAGDGRSFTLVGGPCTGGERNERRKFRYDRPAELEPCIGDY